MESKMSTAFDPRQSATDDEGAFRRLSLILDTLRQDCPWDRVQTLKSLRYLTVEEVHELSEAIIALDDEAVRPEASSSDIARLAANLKKELGDIAMHVVFYAKIAADRGLFTLSDVYNAICDKLIERHPFIYRKEEYHGESWEQLKMREGRRNVLEGVPDSLPSLVKAIRMQEKVAGVKPTDNSLPDNVRLDDKMTEADFGQLLFQLVDWARRHGINADDALCIANRRFREENS